MTTIRYGCIACDGCGMYSPSFRAQYKDDPGAPAMRRRLHKNGWRRVPGGRRSGKDYCDACAPNHPEAK